VNHDAKVDRQLKLAFGVGREGYLQVKIEAMAHNQSHLKANPLNGVSTIVKSIPELLNRRQLNDKFLTYFPSFELTQ
jgi:hypothetical protein